MSTRITPDWQAKLGLAYAPSSFQAAIFDFVANGRGHGVVKAVAGSGKTTTIVSAARLIESIGLFLAFNKPIADMLGAKLKGTSMAASTVHSHGFSAVRSALGRVKVDGKKYRALIDGFAAEIKNRGTLRGDDCTCEELAALDDGGFPASEIAKLLDLARLGLVDCDADGFGDEILGLADHHRIDIDPSLDGLVVDCVRLAMQWGIDNPYIVDFTDMVWLPTVLGLRPTAYAWIFVDECQDISRAHLALIRSSLMPGGRALFVGDPRQAIYGFAGADAASFANIIERTQATVLDLSVCYRCPTSVIALAQEITPQIQARPGAPEGKVRSSTIDDFVAEAREGDMVLCRINAPLLSLAFKLIASGVSAAVRGTEIGKGLGRVVSDCTKRSPFSGFGLALDAWEVREIEIAGKRFKDADSRAMRIEAIQDQAECVRIIYASSGATTASELRAAIDRLFADGKPSVVLSSVHRAKGLEADRVFIAKPERLGVSRPGAQPWMVEQEANLEYVAYTRALSELVFLGGSEPRERAPLPESPADAPALPEATDAPAELPEATTAAQAPAWRAPEALPPVDAGAPDTYDASSAAARVALARRLDAALRAQGFAPVRIPGTVEVVYDRERRGRICRVYSTIVGREVRGLGKDAIRVCLILAPSEPCVSLRDGARLGKARRVNRVGQLDAIIGRVQERISQMQPEPEPDGDFDGDFDGDGDFDDGPALLPTSGSCKRAGMTLASGINCMDPGDVSDRDIADAYLGSK